MKNMKWLRKGISALLALNMLLLSVPLPAFAAAEDGLCEHHPVHTAECGYVEAVQAHDCHYQCADCTAVGDGSPVPETAEDNSGTGNPSPTECDCGTDDTAIHATTCGVYVAPENPQCYCTEKCTEVNEWCDVCGFDYTICEGADTAAVYTLLENAPSELTVGTDTVINGGELQETTSGEGWNYDSAANILTLNNANITGGNNGYGAGIYYEGGDLIVKAVGNNTVGHIGRGLSIFFKVDADNRTLTITGDGSLILTGSLYNEYSTGEAKINIVDTTFSTTDISGLGDVTIINSTVIADGAGWAGIYSEANVTITNSYVVAKSSDGGGIQLSDTLTISNSQVEIDGSKGDIVNFKQNVFTNSVITTDAEIVVYGDATLQKPLTVSSGESINFETGASVTNMGMLTIEDGAIIQVNGAEHTHNADSTAAYEKLDETYHTRKVACVDCPIGYIFSSSMEKHSSENENNKVTCTKQAVCDHCGESYGEASGHIPEENATYTDNGNGTHSFTCSVCGKAVTEDHNFENDAHKCVCGKKITPEVTAPTARENLIYDGTSQALINAGSTTGGTLQYSLDNVSWNDEIPTAITVGIYTVYYKVVGDENFEDVAAQSMIVTIAPIELTLRLSSYGKEYDGTNILTSYEANVDGFIFYDEGSYESDTLDYDDVYDDVSVDREKLTVTLPGSKVGTYTTASVSGITLIGEDAANYTIASEIDEVPIEGRYGDFEIGKATITITTLNQNVELGAEIDQNAYTVEGLPQNHEIRGVVLEKDGNQITVNTDTIVILNAENEYVEEYFDISCRNEGVLTEVCQGHTFNAEGFCATGQCQNYQSAKAAADEYGNTVYEISNAGQLYWYAQQINEFGLSAGAVLTANIVVPENAPNWVPIGNVSAYCAAFDGQNHTISGLKCETTGRYAGLFGYTDYNYTIQNIGILNSSFKGTENVGALIGCAYTNVTNCYAVNTTVEGSGNVGGLIGYNGGSVSNSFTDGSSCVGYSSSGYGATVENCYYLSETATTDGSTYYVIADKAPADHPGDSDIPQTGDNSHLALWSGLLVLSLFALFFLVFWKRRKKEDETPMQR